MNTVDTTTRRRAVLLALNALTFAGWQMPQMLPLDFAVSPSRFTLLVPACMLGWLVSLIMLVLGDLRSRKTFPRDELSVLNRAKSIELGYWTVLAIAAAALVLNQVVSLSPANGLRVIVVAAVAVPGVAYLLLERRGDDPE